MRPEIWRFLRQITCTLAPFRNVMRQVGISVPSAPRKRFTNASIHLRSAIDFRDLSICFGGGSKSGTFRVQTDMDITVLPEVSGFWLVQGANVYTGCIC